MSSLCRQSARWPVPKVGAVEEKLALATRLDALTAAVHREDDRLTALELPKLGFVGDGIFVGDGGNMLQCLWQSFQWRALHNCPGRYSMVTGGKGSELAGLNPQEILTRIFSSSSISGNCIITSLVVRNKDPILLTRFSDKGGGALLSYLKGGQGGNGGIVIDGRRYTHAVHTLNTESGLGRKMAALHLSWNLIHNINHHVQSAGGCASLRVLLTVLAFVSPQEHNPCAYALTVALHRAIAIGGWVW